MPNDIVSVKRVLLHFKNLSMYYLTCALNPLWRQEFTETGWNVVVKTCSWNLVFLFQLWGFFSPPELNENNDCYSFFPFFSRGWYKIEIHSWTIFRSKWFSAGNLIHFSLEFMKDWILFNEGTCPSSKVHLSS